MPFPRPVSPITFETCTRPTDDIAYDELLGSDDELDEPGRAAKRRRVERLAESYLRGNQLLILSASLRGPFEGGWKNPWRKERRTGDDVGSVGDRDGGVSHAEPVVQETGPRPPKHREDLSISRPPLADVGADVPVAPTSPTASSQRATPFVHRSGQKRPVRSAVGVEQNLALPRPTKKPKETCSYASDEQATIAGEEANWLKKDRKRMNFKSFEPPSSPTPKTGARHAEIKARQSASRTGEVRASKTVLRDGTPGMFHASESVHRTSLSQRTVVPVTRKAPEGIEVRPQRKQASASPKCAGNQANSFRVMSSTSQLPRFEFRRWNQHSSPHGSPNSPTKEMTAEGASAVAVEDAHSGPAVSDAQGGFHADAPCNGSHADDQPSRQSRSIRFADTSASEFGGIPPHAATEQDSCERLPSAQQVSPAHETSDDRMPSLHSTAMPKTDTAPNTATSPESQLSTQAALLHAQKSFQDDLESPEQVFGRTTGQSLASPAADDSVLLANETPYRQPNTSEKALLRSSRQVLNGRMQAMSTQCMLDAATPYTFSTEKKPNAYRTIYPQHNDAGKPRTIPHEQNLAPCSNASSPSPEIEYQTAQSDADGSSPRGMVQLSNPPPTHRSTTQGTALPFALSESTPGTMQDGQGGLQGAESFNLSQAIAEAGSWLQQSFDFLNELRQSSQHG